MNRIQDTLMKELVPSLKTIDDEIVSGITEENVIVTKIPDFGSLAVCAQECGKAVFEVKQEDTALINNGVKWTGATWNDAVKRMESYEQEFEKILDKLAISTRSPRGRFSKANSWILLEKRLPHLQRRTLSLHTMAGAAAVAVLCVLGWWAYYMFAQYHCKPYPHWQKHVP